MESWDVLMPAIMPFYAPVVGLLDNPVSLILGVLASAATAWWFYRGRWVTAAILFLALLDLIVIVTLPIVAGLPILPAIGVGLHTFVRTCWLLILVTGAAVYVDRKGGLPKSWDSSKLRDALHNCLIGPSRRRAAIEREEGDHV